MNNTTLHLNAIPPEKLGAKIRRAIYGVVIFAAGYLLLKNDLGPVLLGATFAGVGGALVSLELIRTSLPMAKDVVNFGVWAIKKLKGAVKNGD